MSEPTPPPAVKLTAPDGSLVEADAPNLDALLSAGYRPTTADEESAFAKRQAYDSQDGRTFLEGVARGGTLGLSDAVQAGGVGAGTRIGNWFADKLLGNDGLDMESATADREQAAQNAITESKADILGRQQTNTVAAGLGEATGGIGLGLATGGLGTSAAAGAGLRAAGMSAEGLGLLGRVGLAAATGAGEGAVFGAAKAANDDFLSDREITAERMLLGAGEGALLGGAFGGGATLLGAGAKAAGKYAVGKLSGVIGEGGVGGYVDKLAGDSAFKAVVGRTSKSAIKKAERFGGASEVGETLLKYDVPLTGSADEILAATTSLADDVGKKLGALAKEADTLGGSGPSKSGLRERIQDEVLAPLREGTFSEGTADVVEARLKKMLDKLTPSEVVVRGKDGAKRQLSRDAMSFEEMRAMRVELDGELANWNNLTADKGPLMAYRDVRRLMENYWLDSAEEAAKKAGKEGFSDSIRALKKDYSHLALARDEAQEAALTQLANRATSLTDTIAGAGTAGGVGGPLGMLAGVATSQAHRFIRERGRGMLATALYRARQVAARGEQRLDDAAAGLLTSTRKGTGPQPGRLVDGIRIAGVMLNPRDPKSYEKTIDNLMRLQDASSEERQRLRERNGELASESPEHAQAIDAMTQATADFLLEKAGPSGIDVTKPFAHLKGPKHDAQKAIALARYARAAQNPGGALERVAEGKHSREDIETLKTLYPRLWTRFGAKVQAQLASLKKPPTYRARVMLSQVLGQPMTAFDTPQFQAHIAAASGTAEVAEQQSAPKLSMLGRSMSDGAAGSDQALARGE